MPTISIEIFKTNVTHAHDAEFVLNKLSAAFPHCQFNFDLEDCDKILRVEGNDFIIESIESEVTKCGFICRLYNH